MSNILRWPDEFDDSTPPVEFGVAFEPFLQEMLQAGATVFADRNWALFEFCKHDRCIHFIRRGKAGKVSGQYRMNREMYWEVVPTTKGEACRLGPLFGIREFACVVVCGLFSIRSITERWLDGSSLEDVIGGIEFWDKMDTTTPLKGDVEGRTMR